MRELSTTRFGNIEVDETRAIRFADGIPAFEDEHEFVIIPYNEEMPFLFLQSTNTPDLAFLMVNPFIFFTDYEFTINDTAMDKLQIKKQEDILIFSLLTVPDGDVGKTTANLLAPIVINQLNHRAVQLILENTDYTTKHLLMGGKNMGDDKKC
ncbi:flagellar assembly protein FliW [Pectinatus frisingensis]|uniref:flagellar assembly protein FliW n=1 Tax=Pectinatus frisingensis TaxID=865 RepID=UPI0018C4CDF6|nr:flagellar assembly protein FliW [Pectinatus frisingensis]